MPRPSKKAATEAPKPPVAAVPVAPAQPVQPLQIPQRHIDVEGFIRVRDSVHQRLITILELIKNFSEDYYRQTSLLLGESANDGIPGIDHPLVNLEHAVAQNIAPLALGLPGGAAYLPAPVEEKKERKKRTHDPNAPKRPLTPYFLYMQTARPIIALDLGDAAPKGAVQEEGQRRWKAMNPAEKAGWNNAYQYNLRLYQARVHAYKQGGNSEARLMDDDAALKYAEEHNIQINPVDVVPDVEDAIAEQLNQANTVDAPGEDEEEDEAPAPVKTPKKPASTRKRKTATPAAEAEAKNTGTPASPDKKRRRTSTKVADAVEPAEPAKKSRAKKAKA
ncbi:HMG box protein [Colletotrichum higginsianum IMI 349063]|uniref:HMG box protein n=4 Tax=Colletotrichum destructivum species complex TaxID=2707350 RepID=A0A1B7YDI0_COLHI|nr:HMG box protein [Colletotrichum higginsianum IMI 349063]OBR10092.1 HMG box protein [Colletotrichum higginsianum IMI 349063]TID07141.1 High mobility group protein 1 [Colletotrichum higginsianum]WQF87254.1 Putative High mobility group box domain-containing protein [Colletotrichum destructivum]GJD02887.1 HMG box protein [Colletotrichum higginsianum]